MPKRNKKPQKITSEAFLRGANRSRTGLKGFADPCLTAWLSRRVGGIILPVFSLSSKIEEKIIIFLKKHSLLYV
ncbi:hypothetical protein LNTAR_14037 [Lentisphaera araneosa HTCC2155]|uniref:Uncharacterized protein n=1 Tax=Lentisphaera araneosa HTCC2155 TaxID=313628 RepID=A6DH59_9BACT|nr:hypothetical protein LNTAR_14037 [Lentisphaera araneosa HTCC2155]